DTKVGDSLDISLDKLSENYAFFLPWAGMEKTQIQNLNLADTKAAEQLGQLYDIIIQDNQIESDRERHALNIFLSRLLFCFFAEDTGIFAEGQFTSAIASHTQEDGSDCPDYLNALFKLLNVKNRKQEPTHLKAFPYVNGGLFAADFSAPKLNAKARKLIIHSGTLDWKQINPDIFGSMMQAVVHSDQRGSLGMHYTSVANIMKVIEPLFLNDLKEQLESAGDNEKKLIKLLGRLYHLRLFDPACGSGNFLIIAYKELCKVEIEIFQTLQKVNPIKWKVADGMAISGIRLTQFYGIELDDFAHETAKLSLWLAEHQMNLAFQTVFGEAKPTLPLQEGGNIVCGNATRLDWEEVCPKDKGAEIYIMGNPPYLGARMQSKEQKADMSIVFDSHKDFKDSDYICCWFLKGIKYIDSANSALAFVSTNSISQGEQVGYLWPRVLEKVEIGFAYQSFKWTNNAKGNAGVTCVVVGLRNISSRSKFIMVGNTVRTVKNISPYLSAGINTIAHRRKIPISKMPKMVMGNMARDGGNLILSKEEVDKLINNHPNSERFIRKLFGAFEFLNSGIRWCLWIADDEKNSAEKILPIKERIKKTYEFRIASKAKTTQQYASIPYKFAQRSHIEGSSIIIPRVSSERRIYIPFGFISDGSIISDSAQAIYQTETFTFAIISSRIHMTWVRTVAGRLKTDYRYSSTLCYNTFPFPEITEAKKNTLEDHVFKVIGEREKYPEKTMAELYDPDKMPDGLRQVHHQMDLAVEQCYRKKPFKSDEERLEYLFKLYEEMIALEANPS
ncbi:MAG: class I SAM-dependent DNA methyltransferase, partial [Methyloprofundus sp.]|nr:class I SAM-dependent DNA methyltransferase [Methyloprofundus sp.]